ncbi:hypothetical protein EV426DRAFT_601431 [Tirmania nivea]|nr:hypothetical protein EV426DRAFT_601431 [Tirmania nivea]
MSTREDISQAGKLIGIISGLCSFSCVVISVRVLVRLQLTKQGLGLDDAFMLAAMALLIAETIVICFTTKYGLGKHIEFVDPEDVIPLFQLAYTSILTYVTLIFTIKQSLLLFYQRLTTSRIYHAWCWGFIGLNTVLWFIFFIAGIFPCHPVRYFWDKGIPGGSCVNLEKVYLANAALTVITDIAALLLPVRVVWNLTTRNRSSKLQLGALLMFGFFVCIASFVRMTTLVNFNTVTDFTWLMAKSHIWSMIEVNVGITTVCAPTIKPLFTRYFWGPLLGISPKNSSVGRSRNGGRSLSDNPNLPDSFDKSPGSMSHSKKKDFKKEEITTENFIEHEMAQYGMMGFDEESGHARSGKGGTNSASTSQRDLAGESDVEAEPQQQQPSNPL